MVFVYLFIDIEFVKTFLLTYQSFATPDKLLRKLIERYNVVLTEGMALSQFNHVRQTIQARVINALRLWVEYGVDFKGKLLIILRTCTCTVGSPYKGHLGIRHFVLYIEVVLSLEVQNDIKFFIWDH